MRLNQRVANLEKSLMPGGGVVVIHHQYPDQPNEEAAAAYEAEHGPIHNPRGDLIRVFIRMFD